MKIFALHVECIHFAVYGMKMIFKTWGSNHSLTRTVRDLI